MARMKHYVVVRHQPGGLPYLFDAPLYADIQKGDEVYCETAKGINKAVVVSRFKTDEDSFMLNKVKEICGLMPGTKIKHIESVVKRIKLDYTQETSEATSVILYSNGEMVEERRD